MFVGGCVCGGLRVRDCHRSTFITVVRELGKIGSAVGKVPRFDLIFGNCCYDVIRVLYKCFLNDFLRGKLSMIRRLVYSRPDLLYRQSSCQRAISTTNFRALDKKKVDELLNPLSQKYADAKDEVSLIRSI